MPYSVAARNDEHRNRAMLALQNLGVDRCTAVMVCRSLAGKWAKKLAEELKTHRCPLPDSISQALNEGDGVYRP